MPTADTIATAITTAGTLASGAVPQAAPAILAVTAAACAIVREADEAKLLDHARAALAEWRDGEHDTEADIAAGLDVLVAVLCSVPGISDSIIDTVEEYPEAVAAAVAKALRAMASGKVDRRARRTARALRHLRATRRVIPASVADYAPVNRALLPGAVADRVEAVRAAQVGDSGGPMTDAPDDETSGPRPVVDPVLEIDDDTGEAPVAAPAPVVA